MATTKVPVKSILKQPNPQQAQADEAKAKAARDRQNYSIALNHAHRIQDQKDWEARILNAIQVLVEYVAEPDHSPQEARKLVTLIQPFQPSDLDALIEERLVDSKCGYALCAKVPRGISMGKNAEWKVGKYAKDFCSGNCARKSAYLRTQLSEIPVWERDPSVPVTVQLPEQDRPADFVNVPRRPERRTDHVETSMQDLALERGEKAASFRAHQVMADRIVEKAVVEHKAVSHLDGAGLSSTAIEGYEPKGRRKVGFADGKNDGSDEDDD